MDDAATLSGPSAGGSAAEIRSRSDYKPEKADGSLRREGRRLASNPYRPTTNISGLPDHNKKPDWNPDSLFDESRVKYPP